MWSKQSGAEREKESTCVCVSGGVSQLDKKTVADHSSSVEGADERKRGERKEHSFILSFSILPLGPQKITSHLILGDKQLAWSASPLALPAHECGCVCLRLVYLSPQAFAHIFY